MATNIFVYGTLLFSEITDRLGIVSNDDDGNPSDKLKREKGVLLGYERFTVRLRQRGNFPAIIPSPDSVNGQILFDLTDESLAKLDQFEGIKDGLYTREKIRVGHLLGSKASLKAETYVCGECLHEKLDGPWDPEQFRENELNWYVENLGL